MEKVFWLTLYPFTTRGDEGRGMRSGPFSSQAEAERALREALGTGKFASGSITANESEG